VGTRYELTELGNTIANVRLVKRIDLAAANKLVADLLDRVDGINEDENCFYRIEEIRAAASPTRTIWVTSPRRCTLRAIGGQALPMPA
jgi:hypothetical protein